MRALLALLAAALVIWGAPLLGLALAGAPLAPHLEFPPRTQAVAHAPFSWLAFAVATLPALGALALYATALARARPQEAPSAGRFPWWGWAGLALAALGWALAWSDVAPPEWRRHTFTPLWLGYIVVMNALAFRRSGRSPLTHQTGWLLALFPASAVFWWLFEYLNRYVGNWYYTGIADAGDWDYFLQGTLPFSTVLPAVASTRAWLATFPRLDALSLPPLRGHASLAWAALAIGALALAGIGLWPEALFAMLWIAPLLVLAGLQRLVAGETLFAPLARGDWRPVLLPALAALVCGVFWELWNWGSAAQWHYSVPYVQRFHVFEMPLLGYAGYLPFGVTCTLAANLVARPGYPRRMRNAALIVVVLAAAAAAAYYVLRPSPQAPASRAPAQFAGSDSCASCHADQHARWRSSQHALAMQHASEKSVLGDFGGATFRYAGIESAFYRREGKYFTRTDGPDGKLAEFEVKYAFGVYPLQQYLIEFPDGRLQALSIAWDARPKAAGGQRWFHLYPKEKIDFRDELHWTRRAQNWNFMCADCHSTNLRRNYDAAGDTFKTSWSEISVGCEACHGPGSRHVAEPKEKLAKPDLDTCAQCHARRSQIAEGFHGGKRFLDHYRPELLAPGLYHPDGQQRDEVYVWGSFLQSKMHRMGVTCQQCHEPHSAKTRAQGNALCAQCHEPAKFDVPAHHFHQAGARCADCHMPTETYMGVDPRRDHSLRVPRPDLSVALGVPNACNACHADKDARWAAAAVQKWYGRPAQGFQRFAATLADGASADLAALALDVAQPEIARASALAALERRPSREAAPAIQSGLAQSDPLLRLAALGALRPFPPEERLRQAAPLLDDPLHAVRIEAASVSAGAPGAEDLPAFRRAAAEFERAQRLNADRPEARTTLGAFYAARGMAAQAEAELRAALAMAPEFAPGYVNLADLYRAQGRDADALAALDDGLKKVPRSAPLHYARGLALVRLQRMLDALQALRRATQLAPEDARFAFVYAVALNDAGRKREALAELDRALARHPRDAQLLSAREALSR